MGISQQIGASSLSKPGVCTSSTRPATPYEGQQIYETDTDKVYVWNASAWKQFPTAATAGAVLQRVSTTKTTVFTMSSATFATVTGLTATITPSSTASKIFVMATIQGIGTDQANSGDTGYQIVRDTTAIAINTDASGGKFTGQLSRRNTGSTAASAFSATNFLDSPATTSAITYAIQVRNNSGGTVYVNRDVDGTGSVSSITLFEVSA
jgi:hypothetical protein